jgi:peptidoglycan/xylan/chitin deacetylase (PgdA/CDA1 family)
VALTFDDGPSALTPQYLSALQAGSWPATFFNVGDMMHGSGSYPQYVQAEAADGMAIENHTMTHPDLTSLTPSQITAELSDQQQLTQSLTGYTETLYRPPYGLRNATVDLIASSLGLTMTSWTYSTGDAGSTQPTTAEIVSDVLANARAGSIILMHDGRLDSATVAAIPQIIAGLRAKGLVPGKIVPSSTSILDVNGDPMFVNVVPF